MAVKEDGGLRDGYLLKLNSYDLGVDIELADALQRLRFEHPEVKVLVVTSVLERMFCAGANIKMLGSSRHPWKVNFCKYTNETRLYLEDASERSGLKTLAALNGIAAGGGYELALACDRILLVDDGASVVSLPEVPLLGVLPGTGGLTRVTDKRKVRRDLADVFCSDQDGVKGERAVKWHLVDALAPRSSWDAAVAKEAKALAAESTRPGTGPGITLTPLDPELGDDAWRYRHVSVDLDRARRVATLTVRGPEGPQPETPEALFEAGADAWCLRAFRELDDALLRLRLNEGELGTLLLRTEGDPEAVLAVDRFLQEEREASWLVNEVALHLARVLRRLDMMAKSLIALVEPGSCFAGSLAELAFAADRSYMLDDPDRPTALRLGATERRPPEDGQRPDPPRVALPRDAGAGRGGPRPRRRLRRRRRPGGGPRDLRPRRHRLGGRGAPRGGGARQPLAGRPHRDGGEPALRRPRDHGDQDLRAALGLAELDLPAPQRRGQAGRPDPLRAARAARVRFRAHLTWPHLHSRAPARCGKDPST